MSGPGHCDATLVAPSPPDAIHLAELPGLNKPGGVRNTLAVMASAVLDHLWRYPGKFNEWPKVQELLYVVVTFVKDAELNPEGDESQTEQEVMPFRETDHFMHLCQVLREGNQYVTEVALYLHKPLPGQDLYEVSLETARKVLVNIPDMSLSRVLHLRFCGLINSWIQIAKTIKPLNETPLSLCNEAVMRDKVTELMRGPRMGFKVSPPLVARYLSDDTWRESTRLRTMDHLLGVIKELTGELDELRSLAKSFTDIFEELSGLKACGVKRQRRSTQVRDYGRAAQQIAACCDEVRHSLVSTALQVLCERERESVAPGASKEDTWNPIRALALSAVRCILDGIVPRNAHRRPVNFYEFKDVALDHDTPPPPLVIQTATTLCKAVHDTWYDHRDKPPWPVGAEIRKRLEATGADAAVIEHWDKMWEYPGYELKL